MNTYLTIPVNFSVADYYRFRKLNEIIQSILDSKKDQKEVVIIDIGSGDGQFMKYIKENCPKDIKFKFIGIDKYISDRSFDFDLRNEDIEDKINLQDNYADIIIAAEIIEHIKNTDTFIKELKRILKNDGSILITTPNLASYFNRFLLLFGYQPYHSEVSDIESGFGLGLVYKVLNRPKYGNKTAGHLRLFTFRALKDFVEYYGFEVVLYCPAFFSYFREDNKRVSVIKCFYILDRIISRIFPTLATGMIFHLKK